MKIESTDNSKLKYLLVGNPNCGKSTLFNKLTGLRQKTGNFVGVTVEKKVGTVSLDSGDSVEIWDLPGSYSLEGNSEDKKVTTREILSRNENDRIIFVMDSIQIERSFQFLSSLIDTGAPIMVVLTMKDLLKRRGVSIDIAKLEELTGLPVHFINAKSGEGVSQLLTDLRRPEVFREGKKIWNWNSAEEKAFQKLTKELNTNDAKSEFALQSALMGKEDFLKLWSMASQDKIQNVRRDYNFSQQEALIQRSIGIKKIISQSITHSSTGSDKAGMEKADNLLLHPFWGIAIFLGLMALVFQLLFTWAEFPMEMIEEGIASIQEYLSGILPEGPLSALLVDGAIGGVGAVIVFIPQLSLLFFFIGLMEESGYMARVSFVMDRVMGKFGLSGKSFIPLLSSAACAVPAIMGARTIENKSDRMATIMVSPLIMCSARYPVYILVVGAVFSAESILGVFSLQGFVLFSMFLLGLVTSLSFGLLFKKTVFKESSSYFMMELPTYKMPSFLSIFQNVYSKIKAFLMSAGQIILYISILLWFIAYYPIQKDETGNISGNIKQSYAASLGKSIEPIIEPLGFDWKIGISLITSFAAREVMVSTLAIIYEVEDDGEESVSLREAMRNDTRKDGSPLWTPITGLSILVFFAFASQCMSTLAVVRRETNSYFWPAVQFAYMTTLAYIASLLVYQIGNLFI